MNLAERFKEKSNDIRDKISKTVDNFAIFLEGELNSGNYEKCLTREIFKNGMISSDTFSHIIKIKTILIPKNNNFDVCFEIGDFTLDIPKLYDDVEIKYIERKLSNKAAEILINYFEKNGFEVIRKERKSFIDGSDLEELIICWWKK